MKTGVDGLLDLWNFLADKPFGPALFSFLVRFVNPYTGRLGARVEILEKGHAKLSLKDKKANRNHLNSVHAVALTNLGEFTSGIAVLASLDGRARGIVTELNAEYLKKARGPLMAECQCVIPQLNAPIDLTVTTHIFNDSHELVCRVTATWRLEPLV